MFKKIILIISILFLLVPSIAIAESQITFAWDVHADPDVEGYRLYQSNESVIYDLNCPAITIPVGTETATLYNVPDGTWFWVITAYDQNDNESEFSNEVTTIIDTMAPSPPKNFIISIDIKVSLE